MKHISEKEFDFQMKEIKNANLSKERARQLREEKNKGKRKLPQTSKMILLSMILLCLQIVIFCEYAMLTLGDASSMYVLIGIPAALAPIIWGYYSKSKAENVAGGIVYESAMAEIRSTNEDGHETNNSTGDAAG